MKVYFYHTQNIQYCLRRMAEGEFPSHFLYGACHLADNGVDVVYHRSPKHELSRLKTAIYTAWRVLTCRERFDAIYATHYKGLELVVLLRALGLFRKPIVVWHHQPIVKSKSRLRELLGRFFYKGFDRLIFFSQKLVDDSLKAPKADPRKLVVGHWGADLAFYDKIKAELKAEQLSPSHPNDSQLSTLTTSPQHHLNIFHRHWQGAARPAHAHRSVQPHRSPPYIIYRYQSEPERAQPQPRSRGALQAR